MSKETFFCHNQFQEFVTYKHKLFEREYKFGKCSTCGKHFYLKDGEIIEGKTAKQDYKYIRKNLIIIKPSIVYLKSLRFGVPARKTIFTTTGKQVIEYQLIQIDNKGKIQTVGNTLDAGFGQRELSAVS